MAFSRSFKSIDPTGIKLLEFVEIVNPVRAKSRSVADKLTPYGSAEPVFDRYIVECANRYHRREIVARWVPE
jgi:hypothetical protein